MRALLRFGLIVCGRLMAESSAFAAGTISGISMMQQLDEFAKPLGGGKLFLIQAGTTSAPQNCYQDTALTLALQLLLLRASESMGNHDSNVVGAGRVG
ncbi:hypothetical protein IVB55_27790 [Bradyrhizobium sp. CW4]|nr:hypothetical protein [Bradyrhizobium sp. CW4]